MTTAPDSDAPQGTANPCEYDLPMPADEAALTRFLNSADSDETETMRHQITDYYGEHTGGIMWHNAMFDTYHARNVRLAVQNLTDALTAAHAQLYTAAAELHRLRDGDAYHEEYAGPVAGADIAGMISSAQMGIRAALAIHQVTAAVRPL